MGSIPTRDEFIETSKGTLILKRMNPHLAQLQAIWEADKLEEMGLAVWLRVVDCADR